MKMNKNILALFILAIIAFACEEEPVGQQPLDAEAPGSISNVKVENTPGGAIITYDLPADEDLLYVKCVYSRTEDETNEAKSSMYSAELVIEGFGDTNEHQVTLIAVDRSRNESEPVTTTIKPLPPPVLTIGETLMLEADFGGVTANWENSDQAEIVVVLLKEDENEEYIEEKIAYTTLIEGKMSLRGLDTIPGNFGVYVQDRWENKSEIVYATVTPLYETQFDPARFKELSLPGDFGSAWGWVMPRLWDGDINTGFHTENGTGIWPHFFTFDMGQTGKISRVIKYQRRGYEYTNGSLRNWEVWGAAELDPSGSWDSWTKLIDCKGIKPSGLPLGQTTAEDLEWAHAGEEFPGDLSNPPVRYIRIKVTENWSGTDFLHCMEMHFFGDNRY